MWTEAPELLEECVIAWRGTKKEENFLQESRMTKVLYFLRLIGKNLNMCDAVMLQPHQLLLNYYRCGLHHDGTRYSAFCTADHPSSNDDVIMKCMVDVEPAFDVMTSKRGKDLLKESNANSFYIPVHDIYIYINIYG